MKNSTRHLSLSTTSSVPLAASASTQAAAPVALQPLHHGTEESSRSGTPAATSEDAASSIAGRGGGGGGGLAPNATATALPPIPGISATSSLGGSPAPVEKSLAGATASTPAAAMLTPQSIDTRYESSKIPLDVAVVESILAAGAEERMKKVAANLLIVGGTGGIHNIGFAVESRYAHTHTTNLLPPRPRKKKFNLLTNLFPAFYDTRQNRTSTRRAATVPLGTHLVRARAEGDRAGKHGVEGDLGPDQDRGIERTLGPPGGLARVRHARRPRAMFLLGRLGLC